MNVARVIAMLRTPCFVSHAYCLKASARLVTGRSFRCARHDLTSTAEIVADLRRRCDHIGCIEDRVERSSVRGANVPAIDGQDACASAEVDAGESLAEAGRPVA